MGKKSRFVILIVIIIAQILVPVGMTSYKSITNEQTCQKGETFKFYLNYIVYNDGSIKFEVAQPYPWGAKYVSLKTDENGYAEFELLVEKPEGDNYIKNPGRYSFVFPVDEIETRKYENIRGSIRFYSMADYGYLNNEYYFEEAYLEAYVYKGNVVPACIYVDGMPLDEQLEQINNNLSQVR